EMTALVGGLRVLGASSGDSKHGVLTDRPGTLSNDFFINLIDMGTVWSSTTESADIFEGKDRSSGDLKWTGTRNDLVFASNSQLRAIAEVYASSDSERRFVDAFVNAWAKVMDLDRFDVA
ncbi:MAG: catalase-peroxidase, partial [Ilumatobacteraceae bacterium]